MSANTIHKQAVTSRLIRTKLLIHFLLFSIAPIVISVLWLIYNPVPRFADLLILVLMWCWVGGVGISLGMHRYFSHGSFEPSRPFEWAMAIAGAMAAQGPISYWVAVHRCHHQHSDTPGDPHSPNLAKSSGLSGRIRSFIHGHVGWVVNHEIPKTKYFGADLRRNKIVRSVDRHYHTWAVLGILIPGCILGLIEGSVHGFISGCVYGGFLRILIVNHVTWSVNSVCHSLGSQPFDTHDHSRNNLIVALFSFGEGWHNNHHAFPWSAKFGLRWWQFDPGWLTLNALAAVRAVRGMKQPTSRQKQQAAPHQSSDTVDTTLATITRQTTTTDPALEAKLVRRRDDDQQRAIRQGDRSRKHDQSNSLS